MSKLTNDEVLALARATDIVLAEPELTEVAHHLNAVIAAMDAIDEPGLNDLDPMPMPRVWPPAKKESS
jgi:Asp-tRNA(Asn)/Glu-tRNA(Gln) amidotransferase C subunit